MSFSRRLIFNSEKNFLMKSVLKGFQKNPFTSTMIIIDSTELTFALGSSITTYVDGT